jgi:hypothetical protein
MAVDHWNHYQFQYLPITISPCLGLHLEGGVQENNNFQDKNLLILLLHPLGLNAATAETGSNLKILP